MAERRPDGGRASAAERQAHLPEMNQEINRLVAGQRERSPEELVPAVEQVMRRYGVAVPSREGILLWIDEAIAQGGEGA